MSRFIPLAITCLLALSIHPSVFAAGAPATAPDTTAIKAQAKAHYKTEKRQAKDEYLVAIARCNKLPAVQRAPCEKEAKAVRKARIAHAKMIRKEMKASATATKH